MNPIILDTEESQEIHRILDWLASTVDHVFPCVACDLWDGHEAWCYAKRSLRLINDWSKPPMNLAEKQARIDAEGRPTMNPHPNAEGLWL